MVDRDNRSYRYSAIKRQMQRVAGEHERHLRQVWIDRVLDILDSDNLIAQAASAQISEDGLVFECNVAPKVWDDPRIAYRRQQLESSNVAVELIDYQHEVAGKIFSRAQIRIGFTT